MYNHACNCFYQQIENGNTANQIHGFTIDYSKIILKYNTTQYSTVLYSRMYEKIIKTPLTCKRGNCEVNPIFN